VAELGQGKGNSQVGSHRPTVDTAAGGVDSGGDIDRQHRQSGGIDPVDGDGVMAGDIAGEAGTEKSVNHQPGISVPPKSAGQPPVLGSKCRLTARALQRPQVNCRIAAHIGFLG
jgi:hypothetical protein